MQTGLAVAACVLQYHVALLSSVSTVAKRPPFHSKDSQIICKYDDILAVYSASTYPSPLFVIFTEDLQLAIF